MEYEASPCNKHGLYGPEGTGKSSMAAMFTTDSMVSILFIDTRNTPNSQF